MPSPFPGMNPYLEQDDAWHDFHESFMPVARDLLAAQVRPAYLVKIDEHVYIPEENAMPSPFPGMNPYLEQDDAWHDFHERFCPRVADVLTAQVRPGYIVKIDEHIYIHELADEQRHLVGRGDVTLARERPAPSHPPAMVLEAPARVRLRPVDIESLSFVEIRDRESRRLVTVVELLSPSNKSPGPDRDQYLAKRRRLFASNVHFVEIDLLRGGGRLPMEGLPPCDYCVLVSRVEDRPEAEAWPIGLRERAHHSHSFAISTSSSPVGSETSVGPHLRRRRL